MFCLRVCMTNHIFLHWLSHGFLAPGSCGHRRRRRHEQNNGQRPVGAAAPLRAAPALGGGAVYVADRAAGETRGEGGGSGEGAGRGAVAEQATKQRWADRRQAAPKQGQAPSRGTVGRRTQSVKARGEPPIDGQVGYVAAPTGFTAACQRDPEVALVRACQKAAGFRSVRACQKAAGFRSVRACRCAAEVVLVPACQWVAELPLAHVYVLGAASRKRRV